jgi:RimJ/RimL family protein N-acetyltransferase
VDTRRLGLTVVSRCPPPLLQYCCVSQATLQTDRIRLVPLSDEHLELEVELDSDPEVMRYLTGDGRTRAQVEHAHGLRLATAQPVAALGFWVGFVKDDFVGWWLLQPAGWGEEALIPGQAELGYRLLRRYWGKGLATEGSREMMRHAFEDLEIQRVFALTMTVNERSRATMSSAGLQYVRTFYEDDDDRDGSELGAVEYAVTKDQWQTSRADAEKTTTSA